MNEGPKIFSNCNKSFIWAFNKLVMIDVALQSHIEILRSALDTISGNKQGIVRIFNFVMRDTLLNEIFFEKIVNRRWVHNVSINYQGRVRYVLFDCDE